MNRMCFLTCFAILIISTSCQQQGKTLRQVAEWMEMEFAFPSEQLRASAIAEGKYVSGNSVPIDMDVNYRDQGLPSRVFVTIPRFRTGIPVTLGIVSSNIGRGGPMVEPYPNYSWHVSHGTDCDGLTSVFRVAIDECNRLWVLDTGRVGDQQYCAPQLVVFNLRNDQLIHRYRFPDTQYRSGTSLFITPIVDVRDGGANGACRNTMVYIADVTGYGLIVYDFRRGVSWRIHNKLIFPHPDFGTFTVAGESFDLMDGILGMALSHKSQNTHRHYGGYFNNNYLNQQPQSTISNRVLLFHALASQTENAVPLSVLDNSTRWESPDAESKSFVEVGSRGIQSAAQAMDKNGNLFFGLMHPIAIACWDSRSTYNRNNIKIVAQNDETLQFASGMKVVMNKKGVEELWVLTCRFQKVMTGSISVNEPNFRIQALQVNKLLDGNRCIPTGGLDNSANIAFPYSKK